MNQRQTLRWIFGLLLLISCGSSPVDQIATAQDAVQQPTAESNRNELSYEEYQRSARIYRFRWFQGSDSSRGEELYFIKCWMCHNEYTIQEDYPLRAPTLVGLYERSTLQSGEPVNDETVAMKIWAGAPGMPSYIHSLNQQDMADLLEYLREDCCWDEDHPPVNPWYRARQE